MMREKDIRHSSSKRSSSSSCRKITDHEISEYLVKKAMNIAKKLKPQSISGYSNDSNPFGDTNLNEAFVWRKKIEKSVTQGHPLPEIVSVRAEVKRRRDSEAEIENARKSREERVIKKARREEEAAMLAREIARAEAQEWEKREQEFLLQQSKIKSRIRLQERRARPIDILMGTMEEGDALFGSNAEVNLDSQVYWWHDNYRPRKPKYFNRVHTGYVWNKYNQTHYDHDNPPPKTVQGYKFNIFYPDLVNQSTVPEYTIEKDGNNEGTCIIRFHAGPSYEDIAFRVVNREWDYSRKKGFKCTFERGMLQLYFNFKRGPYRR